MAPRSELMRIGLAGDVYLEGPGSRQMSWDVCVSGLINVASKL